MKLQAVIKGRYEAYERAMKTQLTRCQIVCGILFDLFLYMTNTYYSLKMSEVIFQNRNSGLISWYQRYVPVKRAVYVST